MALADLNLVITNHAYSQYCDRVAKENRELLTLKVKNQLLGDKIRKGDFLKLESVWWAFLVEGDDLRFVTCYGKSDFDLPQAIAWAKRNGDRIRLGECDAQ